MRYFYFIMFIVFTACQSSSKVESKATDGTMLSPTDAAYLFVGTYTKKEGHVDGKGKGIHILKWNKDDQSLSPHMIIDEPINPSYITLHPSKSVVYCVNEVADNTDENIGTVQAYRFDLSR